MGDIEVEPVESLDAEVVPAGVDAPEYVLYGGKGGVGKTTMAAATALTSARDGTPTLAVSTDPAHSLSDVLERSIPATPDRILEGAPLYAAEIDPDGAAGPFGGEGLGPLDALLGGADQNPLSPAAMPGADEAAAMQLLLEYMDDERFDRVVVDTAPTGHTLRLLQLPDALDSMLGRLLALREQFGGVVDSLGGLFGDQVEEADIDRGVGDLRTLGDRVERLRAALRDPDRTDFRVVIVPEAMSVVEAERLVDRLDTFGIPVGTVVVNRVAQDLADVASVDPDWFVSPDPEHCEFCRRRWDVQRTALDRAQDLFRAHEVRRVPLFADEVRGEAMLEVVATCLAESDTA